MSSRLVPRISIVLIGAFLVGSGCGGTGLATKTDAESGTGGNLASGGAAATGGATGSGGMSTSGSGGTGTGPIASGGIDSDSCSGLYPNNPNCGGAGGNPGTGAVGTGASKEERVERIGQIIQTAKDNGYNAIFAGYGFMAEDEDFVRS